MSIRLMMRAGLAASIALGLAGPANATANYAYKKSEYVTIGRGMAPSGKYSIAAHGDGELGYDNFHLYLMAEPGHRRIGPLEEVKDILDTAASAFSASWSPDSRFVGITHRADRRVEALHIYRIGKARAFPIATPSLLDAAAGRDVARVAGVSQTERTFDLRWTGPGTCRLKESGTLRTTKVAAQSLASLGEAELIDGADPEGASFLLEYAYEADCRVGPGDALSIGPLHKPGP